jgi:hypothetical protein
MLKNVNWLSTRELESTIHNYADENTKTAFHGVFPIDHLPKGISRLPCLFIINTNTGNLPGQHWKAIYIDKNKNGEIFDSLAMPVSLKLQHWMNYNTNKWTVSNLTVQNPLSPTCGVYVLYFVLTRLHYKTLSSCLNIFTSNVMKNDAMLEKLFMK